MYISRIELKNWKNFKYVDIALQERAIIVGANATGKSNFLDAFRFLRDIVQPGGGLQAAINDRGGVKKIRWLNARKNPVISIGVELSEFGEKSCNWKYFLSFMQNPRGERDTHIVKEEVWKNGVCILNRPDQEDKSDIKLLSQTYLEQISQNKPFRELSGFFEDIHYFHLVPQLLRYPSAFSGPDLPSDPFGRAFLERIAKTPEKTRTNRLNAINTLLSKAVPQLKDLKFEKDEAGRPHLTAICEHWRPRAGIQNEQNFSDGTLRLIGLLWTLISESGVILFEEPELSLHSEIIARLMSLIRQAQKSRKKKQFIITSHSEHLLSDESISLSEVVFFKPGKNGTECTLGSEDEKSVKLFKAGLPLSDIVIPETTPENINSFVQQLLPLN